MTSKSLVDQIMPLLVAERLKLLEDAWDSIAASPTAVPVPAWHEAELDRRLDRPSAEPPQSEDEVRAHLRGDPGHRPARR